MTEAIHTQVDKDFIIKVYGLPEHEGKPKLRSSRKTEIIVGPNLYDRIIDRVYTHCVDKYESKIRRGLKLKFYMR